METENSSSGFYLDQLESSQINTKFDNAIKNLTTIVNYLSNIKTAINLTTLEDKIEIVNELNARIASIEAIKKQISDKKTSINTKINTCQNFYNTLVQKCKEHGTKIYTQTNSPTVFKEEVYFSIYINDNDNVSITKYSTMRVYRKNLLIMIPEKQTSTFTIATYTFSDTQSIPKVENIATFFDTLPNKRVYGGRDGKFQ